MKERDDDRLPCLVLLPSLPVGLKGTLFRIRLQYDDDDDIMALEKAWVEEEGGGNDDLVSLYLPTHLPTTTRASFPRAASPGEYNEPLLYITIVPIHPKRI